MRAVDQDAARIRELQMLWADEQIRRERAEAELEAVRDERDALQARLDAAIAYVDGRIGYEKAVLGESVRQNDMQRIRARLEGTVSG